MIGAVLRGPGQLEVGEIETPEIGPDEVPVRVGANTVCGTNVRILRGEKTKGIAQNFVPGHELAGHVAEAGGDVRGYDVGAPVALHPIISCLRCYYCRRGMENVCENIRIISNAVNGGLEEYVRVPAEAVAAGSLFVAGEDLPSEYLALAEPLSCCINGLKKHRVELDETVPLIGAEPIGLFHLQFSLLAGARTVIVSNPSALRRRLASDLGATVTVDPTSEDLAEVVAEQTGGLGVDVIIICIGKPQLVNDAIRLTRKGGVSTSSRGSRARGGPRSRRTSSTTTSWWLRDRPTPGAPTSRRPCGSSSRAGSRWRGWSLTASRSRKPWRRPSKSPPQAARVQKLL